MIKYQTVLYNSASKKLIVEIRNFIWNFLEFYTGEKK